MREPIAIDVFYDYGCPYVRAAAVWLKAVKAELGDQLQVCWRYFPLEQVNSAEGPEWKLWEQPLDYKSKGRDAFHAAIAARRQGDAPFERFHQALLDARHVDGKELSRRETLMGAATAAGLDLAAFERDLNDASLLTAIGADYEVAVAEHGVFGTPTIVFSNGAAAYLKMLPPAPEDEAVAVFDDFVRAVRDRPYIGEIKRPRRPSA